MELICKLLSQGQLEEREFTNSKGENVKFASRGHLLAYGADRIYAETVQEAARSEAALEIDKLYVATLSFSARSWKDQQGKERIELRCIITKIIEL